MQSHGVNGVRQGGKSVEACDPLLPQPLRPIRLLDVMSMCATMRGLTRHQSGFSSYGTPCKGRIHRHCISRWTETCVRHRVLPNLPRHDRAFWSDTVVPEADADPGGWLSHNATGSMGWISGQARGSKWFEATPTHHCPMASGRYGSSCSNLMHGILSPQNASDGFESARSIGRRRTSFVRSRHLSPRSITQQRGVPARAADPRT